MNAALFSDDSVEPFEEPPPFKLDDFTPFKIDNNDTIGFEPELLPPHWSELPDLTPIEIAPFEMPDLMPFEIDLQPFDSDLPLF